MLPRRGHNILSYPGSPFLSIHSEMPSSAGVPATWALASVLFTGLLAVLPARAQVCTVTPVDSPGTYQSPGQILEYAFTYTGASGINLPVSSECAYTGGVDGVVNCSYVVQESDVPDALEFMLDIVQCNGSYIFNYAPPTLHTASRKSSLFSQFGYIGVVCASDKRASKRSLRVRSYSVFGL